MVSKAPCARRPSSTSDCSSLHRAPLPNSPTPGPRTCAVSSSRRCRARTVLSRPRRQTPSRRARRPRLPPARPLLPSPLAHGGATTPPFAGAAAMGAAARSTASAPPDPRAPSMWHAPCAPRATPFLPAVRAPTRSAPRPSCAHHRLLPLRCVLRRHSRMCRLSSRGLLLTARAAAQQRLTLQASPVAGAANTPCQVRRRPLPGWTRPAAHPFIAFAGSVAAAAFPAGPTLLRPSLLDLSSLWLDRAFPSGSVAAV
jgi:hypothetical protein